MANGLTAEAMGQRQVGQALGDAMQATSYLYVTRPPRESSQVPFFAPTTPPPVQDLDAPEYIVHEAVWADLPWHSDAPFEVT